MRRFLLSLLLLVFIGASPAAAQDSALMSLETGDAIRGWEGVGRMDIDGKGFCTAAMIRERLILTAAHCVYDDDGSLIDAARFSFSAGLRSGRAEALRGVTRLVAHPAYTYRGEATLSDGVAHDIAVLELDRPIRRTRVQPFAVAQEPRAGDRIGIVSYGRNRANAASLQEVCSVLGQQRGVLVMTCEVEFGSSGAPVFMLGDGLPQIVSVVSAMSELDGQAVSLGTSLADPLQQLLAHFATLGPARPGGLQRMIRTGERNDTGAKFIRPGGG